MFLSHVKNTEGKFWREISIILFSCSLPASWETVYIQITVSIPLLQNWYITISCWGGAAGIATTSGKRNITQMLCWGYIPLWSSSPNTGTRGTESPGNLLGCPFRKHQHPSKALSSLCRKHTSTLNTFQCKWVFLLCLCSVASWGHYWAFCHANHCLGSGFTGREEKISNWPPCHWWSVFRHESKEMGLLLGTHSSSCLSHLWKKSDYFFVCWSFSRKKIFQGGVILLWS